MADEHMFTVMHEDGQRMGTFRLQLFTAPGAQPVAVATQVAGEGGSLTNRAERYAAAVWHRYFPADGKPPVWVQLQLFPGHTPESRSALERFTLVTFSIAGPYLLASPQWHRMTDADLGRLAGNPVDRDRGPGYEPWPQEPEDQPSWHVAWTALLPRPKGVDRGCMTYQAPWWRCAVRQVIPRRRPRDCCYYHQVDWHRVSAAAIRVVRQARREGLSWGEVTARADEAALAEGLPDEEAQALAELIDPTTGIQPGNGFRPRYYVNGRHRTTSMLEAGVRRTAIIRWNVPGTE